MSLFNNKNALTNGNSGGGGNSDHTHANLPVLNALSDVDDNLYYKGQPIQDEIASLDPDVITETTLKQFISESEKGNFNQAYTYISNLIDNGLEDMRVVDGVFEFFDGNEWTEVKGGSEEGHTHEIDDINGLQDELDDKSNIGHTHEIASIENLQSELDNKSDVNHTHDIGDINDLQSRLSSKSDTNHSHDMTDIVTGDLSANRVTETTQKQFISATDKGKITANSSDIESHGQRIADLEFDISNVSTSDEKVKMDSNGVATYLEDLVDSTTIINKDGKLSAVTLEGSLATIQEINHLQGIDSNIQAQINSLSSIGNFSTTVDEHADLAGLIDMEPQDMVIVLADETKNDATTIYIYNGADWIFSGDFKGGEVRDFITNPLKLDTETTNILPKTKYEKQSASDTLITDTSNNFTSNNVEGALAELFTYANNIKSGVVNAVGNPLSTNDTTAQLVAKIGILKQELAAAITNKGINAYSHDTLSEMANKVNSISSVSLLGVTKRTSKINVTAPYTLNVVLDEVLALEDIASTVLQYVGDDVGIAHYTSEYNNGDESNFDFNQGEVKFDGHMQINDEHVHGLSVDGDFWETDEIDFNEHSDFESIDVDNDNHTLTVEGLKNRGQVVVANGDISLLGVDTVDSFSLLSSESGNGVGRIVVSFNSGVTWNSFTGGTWIEIDINNESDFKSNGMNRSEFNALTRSDIDDIRNESNVMRFAYYLERPSFSDEVYVDKLEVVVSMLGYNELAPNSVFDYTYDASTGTLSYTFKVDGTYSVTYVDSGGELPEPELGDIDGGLFTEENNEDEIDGGEYA